MRTPFVGLVILVIATGCTSTAVIDHWQPAGIDPVGLKRIAVLDFQGDQGAAVATAIGGRLWEAEFYTVVDRAQFQQGIPVGGHQQLLTRDTNGVIQRARELGVDAVLLGEVLTYHCSDNESQNSHFGIGGGSASNRRKQSSVSVLGISYENNHIVNRDASISVAYRLIDVRTGEVRASKHSSHSFQMQSINGDPPLPPSEAVMADLLESCTTDILMNLAPHTIRDDVALVSPWLWSTGRGLVGDGIESARKNDWPRAEAAFRAALTRNPSSLEAKFNLAVALEAQQKFAEAETLLTEVQSKWDDDRVAAAINRLKRNQRNYLAVLAQRDSLNVAPQAPQLVGPQQQPMPPMNVLPVQHQAPQ